MKTCLICNGKFRYKTGCFTRHLSECHNLSKEEYIVLTEFDNIHPKCQCGFCSEDATFTTRTNRFLKIKKEHKRFDWLESQYVLKFGNPICKNENCENIVEKFHRGKPNLYCSFKCQPGNWNQEKAKQTVREKYGVENIFLLPEVIDKAKKTLKKKYGVDSTSKIPGVYERAKATKKERYGDENYVNKDKMKETMLEKYGVEHFSKTDSFKKSSSNRMKKNNPMKIEEYKKKAVNTFCDRLLSGDIQLFKSKKYKNTELYYQSSYELKFLDYCKENNLIHLLENAKSFKYLKEDKNVGMRHIPDFCFNKKHIIEVKSTYILEKQGGMRVINAKKRAVKSKGYTYILLLDNDLSKFKKMLPSLLK